MSDIFDEFNKILKKDLLPQLAKYINDPNNKIPDTLNDFFNDPKVLLNNIYHKFSKSKANNINKSDFKDIENIPDIEEYFDEGYDEYDELLSKLISIEENMTKLEKILKDQIEKY